MLLQFKGSEREKKNFNHVKEHIHQLCPTQNSVTQCIKWKWEKLLARAVSLVRDAMKIPFTDTVILFFFIACSDTDVNLSHSCANSSLIFLINIKLLLIDLARSFASMGCVVASLEDMLCCLSQAHRSVELILSLSQSLVSYFQSEDYNVIIS